MLRARFRSCYVKGIEQRPALSGSITLVAKIGPNGEVLGVDGQSQPLAPIVPCLKAAIAGAQFPSPRSGGAEVSIPITFVAPGR